MYTTAACPRASRKIGVISHPQVSRYKGRSNRFHTAEIAIGFSKIQVATSQRIHSPQPLHCCKLGGVVRLPASTTWFTASTNPKGLQRIVNAARLGSRQPRTEVRFAYPLQLPPRNNLPRRTAVGSSTHDLHSHPSPHILQPVGGTPGDLTRDAGVVASRSIDRCATLTFASRATTLSMRPPVATSCRTSSTYTYLAITARAPRARFLAEATSMPKWVLIISITCFWPRALTEFGVHVGHTLQIPIARATATAHSSSSGVVWPLARTVLPLPLLLHVAFLPLIILSLMTRAPPPDGSLRAIQAAPLVGRPIESGRDDHVGASRIAPTAEPPAPWVLPFGDAG